VSKTFRLTMIALSALYILMGIALLIWPAKSRLWICYAAGAAGILYGIIRIVMYFTRKDAGSKFQFGAAIGLAAIVFGAILVFRSAALTAIFAMVAGAVIVVDSIVKLQMALNLLRMGGGKWPVSGFFALVMLLFGAMLLFDPFKGVELSMILSGIALVLTGATGIWIVSQSARLMKKLTLTQ